MRCIKKGICALLSFVLLVSVSACMPSEPAKEEKPVQSTAQPPEKVVALSSSLAEIWLLAGGQLTGVTSDSFERDLQGLGEDTALVGSIKDPSLESILSLEPDFVILSDDIASHKAFEQTLADAGIEHYYAHVETMDDYLAVLGDFCALTGQNELLEQNGAAVKQQIEDQIASYTAPEPVPEYLLLRMHASGGKAIAGDHVVCDILEDLGAVNIAENDENLLSDLSLEAILERDPDYIFVITMGDEAEAMQAMEQMLVAQPLWNELTAVQNDRVVPLPKDLFHYKPNAKWGDAYAEIISILETKPAEQ